MTRKNTNEPLDTLTPKALDIHQKAVLLSQNSENNWLELGRILVEIRDLKLYQQLKNKNYINFKGFVDYLDNGGFNVKRRSLYTFMKLAEYPWIKRIQHYPYAVCIELSKLNSKQLTKFLKYFDTLTSQQKGKAISRLTKSPEKHLKFLQGQRKTLLRELAELDKEISELDK
jgi:hypothetical protein